MQAQIEHKQFLSPRILQLLIKSEQEYTYRPGDYLYLQLSDNALDQQLSSQLHSFSIASFNVKLIELHITITTDAWHQKLLLLQTGDKIIISKAYPQFRLSQAQNIIFIAGGSGFAPFYSILQQALHLKKVHNQKIIVYWGANTLPDLYLHFQMLYLCLKHKDCLRYVPVLNQNKKQIYEKTLREDYPNLKFGMPHKIALQEIPKRQDASNTCVYICGPSAMLQSAKKIFAEQKIKLIY